VGGKRCDFSLSLSLYCCRQIKSIAYKNVATKNPFPGRRERERERAREGNRRRGKKRAKANTHIHTFTSTHRRTIFTLNQSKSGNLYQPIQSKLLNMSSTTNTSKTFADRFARDDEDNKNISIACQRKEDINKIDFR
jgi:hypothetical protein